MGRFFIQIVVLMIWSANLFAQYYDHRNRKVDSLEHILATDPPTGADLAFLYRNLALGYQQSDVEKSMDYARKTVETAIPLGRWRTVADGYYNIGEGFYNLSQYDSARVYYDKTLEAIERMKEHPANTEMIIEGDLSSTYGQIANVYNTQGMYHEAMDYYTRALKIFEKYGWPEHQTIAAVNIGEMYMSMENWEQAEMHILKADSLAHASGDSLMIVYAKDRLSRVQLHNKEYDRALKTAMISRNYYFAHPEEGAGRAIILNLLADIYLEGYGDYAQAEAEARQALKIAEELSFPKEKAGSLAIISSIHLAREEWRLAEQTALEALATDDSEPANTLSLYQNLTKAYAHLGNAVKAGEYFDKHYELQSSWSTKHYQSAIRDMEARYETEKKEVRITILEGEKRLMTGLGIAALLSLVLFVGMLFFRQKNLSSQKNLAEERLKRMEEAQKLAIAEAELDSEAAERSRLARDLHDGLGGMLAAIKMNMQNTRGELTGDTKYFDTAFNLLDDSMQELRRIAHHLMPDSLTRCGLKTSLEVFCQSIPHIRFHYFGEDVRFDGKLETLLYRSAHELINNALKHAEATRINVQLIQEPDRVSLTVQDNGRGFDPGTVAQGMGLNNLRQRIAVFGGELSVCSEPGKGAEIHIELRMEN